jgi:hypothetical protein
MHQLQLIQQPPEFCAYASGPCDQDFSSLSEARGLFLFGSKPKTIASAIEPAATILKERTGDNWSTWKDMDIPGRMVFCEICKSMRGAAAIYADVTTLNFNLMFEIGFAMGLGRPVRPIRDTSYSVDRKLFDSIGVLDTLGYADFTNSEELATAILDMGAPEAVGANTAHIFRDTPLYVLKGPIETEGAIRLMSLIKKSYLGFRTYDPLEASRLSLHTARREVGGSFGVIAHLLSPNRDDIARAHNALSALICGMAVAEQKPVLMLQEEAVEQPIDYRDLVKTYESPDQIEPLLRDMLPSVVTSMQRDPVARVASSPGLLRQIDLGNTAAENEIRGLREYFVPTGRFGEVRNGHAELVVGRKGSGKTAMYYGLRNAVKRGREVLVLDMKPEGHQFTRLREAVLEGLTLGQQEYALGAFWTYLLSAEVAHKILNAPSELRAAESDPVDFAAYKALEDAYLSHGLASSDDLSQRLLRQIDRMVARFKADDSIDARTDLRELVYGGDIRTLNDAVAEYLVQEKDEVWLLIDNLDKSWATRGSTREDILIMRGLLDATHSLKRQLDDRGVEFHLVVFIRVDIYEHLVEQTPDRGKESKVSLEWDDPELFREIVRRRIATSTDLDGDFADIWQQIAPPLVGIGDTFTYMLERTLLRPRDLLMFLSDAIQVAIDRDHEKVTSDDILHAERAYSEDMLVNLLFEIEDTHPEISDAVYSFQGAGATLLPEAIDRLVRGAGVPAEANSVVELLLWYGFLGVRLGTGEEQYSYTVRYNLRRLTHQITTGQAKYVVHPAFRMALGIM